MEFRYLGDEDRPAIHETFRAAFADYAVRTDFDPGLLDRLMARRGTDLSVSVGAFEKSRMVAVMATGVRRFERIASAYDTFTGVLPAWRGQRLAGRMFDVARDALVQRGIRRFVLEVIESNAPAIRAYERAGFVSRRRFKCFEVSFDALRPVGCPDGIAVDRVERPEWGRWRGWRDWPASWQNCEESIADTVEEVVCLEARSPEGPCGYAVVVPAARDLPQLAVAPSARRTAVGTALLAEAVRQLRDGDALRVINVDAASVPDLAFYGCHGQPSLPAQLEMVLDLES